MGILHNISGPSGPQRGLNRGDTVARGARVDRPAAPVDAVDRLELSDAAVRLAQLNDRPDARVERVRKEIADGTYETNRRIDATIERLFADLTSFETRI